MIAVIAVGMGRNINIHCTYTQPINVTWSLGYAISVRYDSNNNIYWVRLHHVINEYLLNKLVHILLYQPHN